MRIFGEEMRYLNRKLDKWLEQWRTNPDRKPLLVKGARQVGKGQVAQDAG